LHVLVIQGGEVVVLIFCTVTCIVVAFQSELLGDVVQGVNGILDNVAIVIQYRFRCIEHTANVPTGREHNVEGRHHRDGCVVGVVAHVVQGQVVHGHQRVHVNPCISLSVEYVLVNPAGVGEFVPEAGVPESVEWKRRGVVGVVSER